MERRNFLKLIAAGTIGTAIKPEVLTNVPLWNPHPVQLKFLMEPMVPMHLWGIPYHCSNASSGTWLGIQRSVTPWNWRALHERLTIDPKRGLVIIDE